MPAWPSGTRRADLVEVPTERVEAWGMNQVRGPSAGAGPRRKRALGTGEIGTRAHTWPRLALQQSLRT